jgi:hypothetical protein
MAAAVMTDDPVAAVAANPISWCGLYDSNEKRAILKFTISYSQITFKLSFFADWTDFWHGFSFLNAEGAALAAPCQMVVGTISRLTCRYHSFGLGQTTYLRRIREGQNDHLFWRVLAGFHGR